MGAGSRVVVARSLQWPGAFCAVNMDEDKPEANLYVGYGHKMQPKLFTVQSPSAVKSEPDGVIEQAATLFAVSFHCLAPAHAV